MKQITSNLESSNKLVLILHFLNPLIIQFQPVLFPNSVISFLTQKNWLLFLMFKFVTFLAVSKYVSLYLSCLDSKQIVSTWLDTCWLMSQYQNISPHLNPIFDCSRKHIYRHILPLFNPQPKPFSLSETYQVFLVAAIYKPQMYRYCLELGLTY